MAKRKSRLRRLLFALLLLLAAAGAGLWLAGPALVEDRLRAELRARGYPDADLRTAHLGPQSAILREVRLAGQAGPRVDSIEITFDPLELWRQGRVRTVTLRGAQAGVELDREGRFRLRGASLPVLGEAGGSLPFTELRLERGALTLHTPDGDHAVDCRGRLQAAAAGGWQAEGQLALEDGSLQLTAEQSGRTPLRATATLEALPLAPFAPLRSHANLAAGTLYGTLGGTAEATLRSPADWRLRLDLQGRSLRCEHPDLGAEGTAGLRGTVGRSGEESSCDLTLELTVETALAQTYDITVNDLETTLAITSLAPLETAADQTATAGEIYLGRLHLSEAAGRFRLRPDRPPEIRSTDCRWGGGTLRTGALEPTASGRFWSLDLTLQEVRLAALLDLLAGEYMTGEGTVAGTLRIFIPREEGLDAPPFVPVDGAISTDPPAGWLRFTKTERLEEFLRRQKPELAEKELPGGETSMLEMLVQALAQYHFAELRLEFKRRDGQVMPVLFLKRGEKSEGSPLATLTVNVPELDRRFVNQVLRVSSRVNEEVDESLADFMP